MLPLFRVFMSADVTQVTTTLLSGMITQGKKVEEFESKLKEWFSYDHILTLNSATSGLTLALRLLDIQPGDEVLCTPLTCFATTSAVLANRASIKWVDTDLDTCNMDLNDLQRKISPKTKAILFVHWGGFPIDLDKLKEIAGSIPIIEDCAHSFGAEYKGKKLGCHGNIAVFSLQAIKHLTTGDGGLIFLPTKELYDRAKLLRWYGIDRERKTSSPDSRLENDITEWGYKFHMNDVCASIGLCNLPFIQGNLEKMQKNASFYDQELSNLPHVRLLSRVPDTKTASWIYTIRVDDKKDFIEFMTSKDIAVSQVHKRNDVNQCVKSFQTPLPNLDSLEKEIISIPVGWWVDPPTSQRVVDAVKEWSRKQPEVKIRPLQISDKTEYLSLLKQLNGYSCDPSKFVLIFRLFGERLKIYVLEVNGRIVSAIRVFYEPKFSNDVAHIEDLVTDSNHRNRGYASRLLRYVTEEAKARNCYKTILCCNNNNAEFYLKNGFQTKGVEMSFQG